MRKKCYDRKKRSLDMSLRYPSFSETLFHTFLHLKKPRHIVVSLKNEIMFCYNALYWNFKIIIIKNFYALKKMEQLIFNHKMRPWQLINHTYNPSGCAVFFLLKNMYIYWKWLKNQVNSKQFKGIKKHEHHLQNAIVFFSFAHIFLNSFSLSEHLFFKISFEKVLFNNFYKHLKRV